MGSDNSRDILNRCCNFSFLNKDDLKKSSLNINQRNNELKKLKSSNLNNEERKKISGIGIEKNPMNLEIFC